MTGGRLAVTEAVRLLEFGRALGCQVVGAITRHHDGSSSRG